MPGTIAPVVSAMLMMSAPASTAALQTWTTFANGERTASSGV